MDGRSSILRILLWIAAGSLVVATILSLVLGFDLVVQPPNLPDTMDLPTRLLASQPFREARWPIDAASSLLFVIAFGALALAAAPLGTLAGPDRRAGLLQASTLVAGILGVVAGLIYLGATHVTIVQQYCDCGFKTQEAISQFWTISIVQGATDWLSYGAIAFAAIALAASAVTLGRRGLPSWWTWTAWSAAALLALGVVANQVIDSPLGDLLTAVASGVLLPIWAIVLASRSDRLTGSAGS